MVILVIMWWHPRFDWGFSDCVDMHGEGLTMDYPMFMQAMLCCAVFLLMQYGSAWCFMKFCWKLSKFKFVVDHPHLTFILLFLPVSWLNFYYFFAPTLLKIFGK
jgi:hypothetical protein